MLLVKNIAKIVGVDESGRLRVKGRDMNVLGEIDNAWLLADGDRIAAYGTMDKMPEVAPDTEVVDAEGGMLFPSFCDSHTHLVYAGSREQEFLDKINGLSYEEIAKRGGGILNSADRLHETSEDELYEQAMERIREIIAMGTGCVEIKSGYGLTTEDELKMLRVIRRIRETSPITVRATFLGAHAVGRAYKGRQQEYVDLICREMTTMLPGAAFFLEMPYPPARAMIEGGLSVALASDFNPGSSPSGSMKMIVSLACIKMRMTPAEAINAATLNGAYAMGLSSEYGSITVGKKANFFLTTKIPSVAYLPYAYTSLLIHRVFLRGQEVK